MCSLSTKYVIELNYMVSKVTISSIQKYINAYIFYDINNILLQFAIAEHLFAQTNIRLSNTRASYAAYAQICAKFCNQLIIWGCRWPFCHFNWKKSYELIYNIYCDYHFYAQKNKTYFFIPAHSYLIYIRIKFHNVCVSRAFIYNKMQF